jgi:hypothetical protein
MKDCKFCNKKGLLIHPLLYAVVWSNDAKVLAPFPALGGSLGGGVTDLPLGTNATYAVRMAREGFIYVLIERLKFRYWKAYRVIEDAFLYEFNVDYPPTEKASFNCEVTECGTGASVISVENVDTVDNVWLLFTPWPMTDDKLNEYRANAVSYTSQGKLQHFDAKAWVAGNKQQPHTLLPENVMATVAECHLYRDKNPLYSPLGETMRALAYPAMPMAFGGSPVQADGTEGGRLGVVPQKLAKQNAAYFVLYDHIGITQELNALRNEAFKPIDNFMKERSVGGVDNVYAYDVYHAIGELRTAMEKGLVSDASDSVEMRDLKRRAKVEPIFPDDTEQMRRFKMQANNAYAHPSRAQWEAANPHRIAQFEAERERDEELLFEQAQHNAGEQWRKDYAPLLDVGEMERFIGQMNALSTQARTAAEERTAQHLAWLKSERLLAAFDAFDSNDPKSGDAFQDEVVRCILGMEATAGEAVLTEWAVASHVERKNLLLRAQFRDQEKVKREANEAFDQATAAAKSATGFADADFTKAITKAAKGLVGAMKLTDSALDEWLRYQEQGKNYLNPRSMVNVEARMFYLVSTLTRAVFRKSIGGRLELAVAGRMSCVLRGLMGDLAERLHQRDLALHIDQKEWDDLNRRFHDEEKRAKAVQERRDAQQKRAYRQAQLAKAKLEYAMLDLVRDAQTKAKRSIKEAFVGWSEVQRRLEADARVHEDFRAAERAVKTERPSVRNVRVADTPSPTNNYHQVRIAGALAGIEMFALLDKRNSASEHVGWEVTASVLSLGSITLDAFYASAKSIRELPAYKAYSGIEKAGDIARGGFKLAAGFLAMLSGGITAVLDWHDAKKSVDPIQRGILFSRSFAGSGSIVFGSLAAYSYAGPYLAHVAEKKGATWAAYRFISGAANVAEALSKRVLLLRVVAWLGWVGLVLTVADLIYMGVRMYLNATAVKRWMGRCVFRKDKKDEAYRNRDEELQELAKAQNVSGIGGAR